MCPSPKPNGILLAFSVVTAELCQIAPLQPNFFPHSVQATSSKVSGVVGMFESEAWQRCQRFPYQPCTYYAVSTFPPISTQTRAHLLLSKGSPCCMISSLFEAFCVLPVRSTFCKSLARTSVLSSWLKHFRKPDERNGAQGKL